MTQPAAPTARTFWSSVSARIPAELHEVGSDGSVGAARPEGAPYVSLARDPEHLGAVVDLAIRHPGHDGAEYVARRHPGRAPAGPEGIFFYPRTPGPGVAPSLVLRADGRDVDALCEHLSSIASQLRQGGVDVAYAADADLGRPALRVTRMAGSAGPGSVGEALVVWPAGDAPGPDVAVVPAVDLVGSSAPLQLHRYGGAGWEGVSVGRDDLRAAASRMPPVAVVAQDLPGVGGDPVAAHAVRERSDAVAGAVGPDGTATLFLPFPRSSDPRHDDLVDYIRTVAVETRVQALPDDIAGGDRTQVVVVPGHRLREVASSPDSYGSDHAGLTAFMAASRDRGARGVAHRLSRLMDLDGPKLHVRRDDLSGRGEGPIARAMPVLVPLVAQPRYDGARRLPGSDLGRHGVERLSKGFGAHAVVRSLTLDGRAVSEALATMPARDLALLDAAVDDSARNLSAMREATRPTRGVRRGGPGQGY